MKTSTVAAAEHAADGARRKSVRVSLQRLHAPAAEDEHAEEHECRGDANAEIRCSASIQSVKSTARG